MAASAVVATNATEDASRPKDASLRPPGARGGGTRTRGPLAGAVCEIVHCFQSLRR